MTDFQLQKDNMPGHVAFIMDGNGRWAKNRGQARSVGHREGLDAAKRIVKAASDLGISYVTLYTFSTENWKRAEEEVSFLMGLITRHLKKEMDFYRQNRIRVVHSGDPAALPAQVLKEIDSVVESTSEFSGTSVNLAINYGGRDEIIRAVNRWNKSSNGEQLTEKDLALNLDCPDFPDPDLIVRTAGEQRLSNFLIWQSAYAEFYYSQKLWPDWNKADLEEAVFHYQKRNRKFGELMNNLVKRILLGVVAIPLLICLIFLLPHYSHLLLNIVILGLSILGGLEARHLFSKRRTILNPVKAAVVAGVFPLFSMLCLLTPVQDYMIIPLLAVSVSILFFREALMRDKNLIQSVLERLPAYSFLLLFPGFFMSFLIKLSRFEESSVMLIIFLTMVFGNDTFAYFTGMLFGKNNRGIFAVSPKKSFAGLVGGIAAAGAAGFIYYQFFPVIFKNNPVFAVLTGIGIGFTSVIGDLVESALKRSADEKDSGTLMGGRGGVLDSIDSILFSAPLFYYIMLYLQYKY